MLRMLESNQAAFCGRKRTEPGIAQSIAMEQAVPVREYAKEASMRLSNLAKTVEFDLIGGTLGQDVRRSLERALARGAIFDGGTTPLGIFRRAV